MEQSQSTEIVWISIPQFELIEGAGDYNTFKCVKAGSVKLGGELIEFEIGWISDMTSSPLWAHSFVPQLGPHAPAVIIHDKLLDMGRPRKEARFWLNKQLLILKRVTPTRRSLIVSGVWFYDMKKRLRGIS
jgi:hypothetical protein